MPDYDRDLSRSVPQVAHRARAYKLEDNGASDAARRRRQHKEGIATAKSMIRDIIKRQLGQTGLPPMDPDIAGRRLEGWLSRIEELKAKLQAEGASTRMIAPVARRVAREDRRRRKNASTQAKGNR